MTPWLRVCGGVGGGGGRSAPLGADLQQCWQNRKQPGGVPELFRHSGRHNAAIQVPAVGHAEAVRGVVAYSLCRTPFWGLSKAGLSSLSVGQLRRGLPECPGHFKPVLSHTSAVSGSTLT